MGQSAEDRAKAEAIVSTWVWQPADGHNYRFQFATRTLTRFYESASMQPDEIRLVVDYLREQDVSSGISLLNKVVEFGGSWKAKDAWFQTMPGEKFSGSDSTKVRIYQVLFQSADGQSGDGPYTVENGCQYRVKHTFYWDVASLPSLPASSSGDEYTMQGLTRDKETGLYSCVIERKERVQQDVAEYVTTQTAFETRKDEQHIGVKQQNVNSTGKQASVSAGTIVKRQITKNPDCTSSIQNDTIVEKPVSGSVREFRKTLRGTVQRTVDRNQAQPLNANGLGVGETRRSEKTEGQLWNNEVQMTSGEGAGQVSDSCSRSQIVHTDTSTENVAQKPTIEHAVPAINEEVRKEARRTEENTWDVSTTRIVYTPKDTGQITSGSATQSTVTTVGINQPSVPVGGVGGINVVRRVSASPNEHGSFSTSEETTTYTPQTRTVTGGSVSATETVVEGVHQTELPAETPSVNKSVSISLGINDHGSMTTNKKVVVYNPDQRTASGGTTSQQETVTSGINQTSVPTTAPTVNRREDVSVSINDHGSMSTQKRTIVYYPDQRTATGGTTSQQETVTSGINQTAVPTAAPAVNKREDVSVSINDHGSLSTQKRTIVYSPDERTATGGTTSQQETVTSGINQTAVPTATPAVNRREDVSVSINDHGSLSTQKRTIVYQPREAEISWTGNGGTYRYKSFSHNPTVPTVVTPTNGTASASVQQNAEGSFDGTVTTFTPGGSGVTPGVVYHETGYDIMKRIVVLPGGKMCLAKWHVNWERGHCAYSSALQSCKGGISFEGYRSYCSGNSREADWQKITGVIFTGYEYVPG